MKARTQVLTGLTIIGLFSLAWLLIRSESVLSAAPKYEGVVSCRPCHLSPKSGAQFRRWQSGPHARAYRTLSSPKAKLMASELKIESPWKEPKCLKCHTTAYGVDGALRGEKLTLDEGVSCEACHGAGSAYSGRKIMQDIFGGTKDGAAFGLVAQSEKVCVTCHNEESPTFKGFNYDEMVAKISHKTPR